MNMSREGHVLLLVQILFLLETKFIDYLNPDVNDDMKMFEMLGLNPKPFTKVSQTPVIEADSQYLPFKAKMVTSQAHT
jgi:biotin synthase